MSLELGSRLGRIRIDALLGVGGMGSVYQGFDERLERPVAIKEIHADKRTATIRNRFLREARALSQLDHPNICRIYDVLERAEGDYLILELIDGRTLSNHMNDGLSREETLRAVLQSLALAERINDRDSISTLLGNLAGLDLDTGRNEKAEPLMRRQLAQIRELGNRKDEILALANLAIVTYGAGKEEEAIALTLQASDVAKALDVPRIEAMARGNAAYARSRRGDLAAAGRDAEAARALLPRLGGDVETMHEARMGYVYWLIRTGRLAEAERLLAQTEREYQVTVRTLRMRARLAYERRDYKGAARLIRQAKAMGDQWLAQDEAMREAFLESGRTGKAARVEFELPVK